MDKISLKTSATTANLGPGFDVFALALEKPFDLMEIQRIRSGVEIETEGYTIPKKPEKNCAGFVALKMIRDFNLKDGVRIRIKKNIQPGSGLGSSGASSAGSAYALNRLFSLNLSKKELVKYASQGEIISAGFPHCDNVVASILGGFTITYSYDPLKVASFEPSQNLGVVVALPNVEKGSTKAARSIIPKMIELRKLVYNVGHASLLSTSIVTGNIELVKKAMNDCIIEPIRAKAGFLREFFDLKEVGEKLNAGIAASGSGPAILGVIEKERRQKLANAMRQVYERKGYTCEIYITEPGKGIHEHESS